MEENFSILLKLAILLGASKLMGFLSQKIGLPTVIGKIAVGIILGPAILGFITPNAAINVIALIGVIILMFISGLETEIDKIKKFGLSSFLIATSGMLFPILLSWGVCKLFGLPQNESIFVGIVLSATSVSITAQTLMELKKMHTDEAATIMNAAVIDDIMGLVAISIFLGTKGIGDIKFTTTITRLAIFSASATAFGYVFVNFAPKLFNRVRNNDLIMSLIIAFSLLFGWASEFYAGLASITGAYLAGVLVNKSGIKEKIEKNLRVVGYSIFIPIFFANIGMGFTVRNLNPILIISLLTVAIISKLLGCMLPAKMCGFDWKRSTVIGIGMISRGEVALITATIGATFKIISLETYASLVIVAVATTLITPLLLRFIYSSIRLQQKSKTSKNLQAQQINETPL
ncbi:MAG: cation:proton antiporter [Actinobacteria bacterium]|nr:cation:proton antiporter [Actinomycetota bacterium]MCL5986836.1 cation:proton antiporter [Actinomycetota bacterium]